MGNPTAPPSNAQAAMPAYDLGDGASNHAAQQLGYGVLQSVVVDLSGANFTSLAYGSGYLLEQARGDWLYVEPTSVSGALGVLQGAVGGESDTVALVPGRVIRKRFNRLRIYCEQFFPPPVVFNAGNTQQPQNYPVLLNPNVKIFFGTGPCPFADLSFPFGSTLPAATTSDGFANTAPVYYVEYPVTPGALFDAYMSATKPVAITETSILIANINYISENGAGGINIGPTLVQSFSYQSVPAAASSAVLSATYSNVRVPRGMNRARVQIVDRGSAAGVFTNTVQSFMLK
jgi:hypothetical protein